MTESEVRARAFAMRFTSPVSAGPSSFLRLKGQVIPAYIMFLP